MGRLRLTGVICITIFAAAAGTSASAFAENPTILSALPANFTATSGAGTISTSVSSITCSSDKLSGSFTTAAGAGTATHDFEGCKSSGSNCSTAGDAAGIILFTENLQLVAFLLAEGLRLGHSSTLKATQKVTCGIIKAEIRGSVIGLVDNVTSGISTTTATVLFHKTGSTQEIMKCELPKVVCEGKRFNLEATFGAAFIEAGEETEEHIVFENQTTIDF